MTRGNGYLEKGDATNAIAAYLQVINWRRKILTHD